MVTLIRGSTAARDKALLVENRSPTRAEQLRAASRRLDSREGANCSLAARTKSNISATRFSFDGSRTELIDESELTAELVSFEGDVLSVANDSRVEVGSGGIEARTVSLARSSSLTATDVLNLTASAALAVEVSSSIVATAGRVASPVVEVRDDSSLEGDAVLTYGSDAHGCSMTASSGASVRAASLRLDSREGAN